MERKVTTIAIIVGLILLLAGIIVTAVVVTMEEVAVEEAQSRRDRPPIVKVPVKDPEAVEFMKWDWSQAVSSSKCSKFFRVWGYLEEAGLTETTQNGGF